MNNQKIVDNFLNTIPGRNDNFSTDGQSLYTGWRNRIAINTGNDIVIHANIHRECPNRSTMPGYLHRACPGALYVDFGILEQIMNMNNEYNYAHLKLLDTFYYYPPHIYEDPNKYGIVYRSGEYIYEPWMHILDAYATYYLFEYDGMQFITSTYWDRSEHAWCSELQRKTDTCLCALKDMIPSKLKDNYWTSGEVMTWYQNRGVHNPVRFNREGVLRQGELFFEPSDRGFGKDEIKTVYNHTDTFRSAREFGKDIGLRSQDIIASREFVSYRISQYGNGQSRHNFTDVVMIDYSFGPPEVFVRGFARHPEHTMMKLPVISKHHEETGGWYKLYKREGTVNNWSVMMSSGFVGHD